MPSPSIAGQEYKNFMRSETLPLRVTGIIKLQAIYFFADGSGTTDHEIPFSCSNSNLFKQYFDWYDY